MPNIVGLLLVSFHQPKGRHFETPRFAYSLQADPGSRANGGKTVGHCREPAQNHGLDWGGAKDC